MRLLPDMKLFFGFKIDSRLRDALAQASPGNRRYFEDPSAGFLRILKKNEEKWIGKVVDPGLAPTGVEDIQRNIISILNRVAPGTRHNPSTMRIFSIDETGPDEAIPLFEKKNDEDSNDPR